MSGKRTWAHEWQNIKFTELDVRLDFIKRASSNLYSAFYAELFRRYESFDALPSEWRASKSRTAAEIAKIIRGRNSVLSFGCGLGFIEKEIVQSLEMTCPISSIHFLC